MRRDTIIKGADARPGPAGWSRLRRAAIGLYGFVILLVLLALVQVLSEESTHAPVTVTVPPVVDVVPKVAQEPAKGSIREIVREIKAKEDPAWLVNAAHWEQVKTPKIAIVIDDLGLSEEATVKLSAMKGPYTLAFLPYAEDLPLQTAHVRKAGHELMVHLPMEPHNADTDPGTNALMSGLPRREFDRRVSWNLSRFDGFVGINNHMGSLLTEERVEMDAVMDQLKRRGVLFLDSLTSPNSVALREAKKAGVPGLARDIFLDNERTVDAINDQLAKTERIARSRGYAIAIGHPYEETLAALEAWRRTLADKNITLVPLSQLVGENEDKVRDTALMARP